MTAISSQWVAPVSLPRETDNSFGKLSTGSSLMQILKLNLTLRGSVRSPGPHPPCPPLRHWPRHLLNLRPRRPHRRQSQSAHLSYLQSPLHHLLLLLLSHSLGSGHYSLFHSLRSSPRPFCPLFMSETSSILTGTEGLWLNKTTFECSPLSLLSGLRTFPTLRSRLLPSLISL